MKRMFLSALFSIVSLLAVACPVCEKQQPKILQGITHGGGPQSNWDYVIITTATLIAVFTLFFSIKWLVRPGEKSRSHIKYLILNKE